MEKRIAVLGIIVENLKMSQQVNEILHEYQDIIIGRMGIPYHAKKVSVMSVAVDADTDRISAMTGKLGKLDGVSVKAAISKK